MIKIKRTGSGFISKILTIYKEIPLLFSTYFLLVIVMFAIPLLQLTAVGKFIDGVSRVAQAGHMDPELGKEILWVFLLICGRWLCEQTSKIVMIRIQCDLTVIEDNKLIEKIKNLKYENLETTEIRNLINRIDKNASTIRSRSIVIVSNIAGLAVRITGCAAIVLESSLPSAVLLILSAIPMMIIAFQGGKRNYQVEIDNSERDRYADYLSETLMEKKYAYERTLFSYTDFINGRWLQLMRANLANKMKQQILWFSKTKLSGCIFLITVFASGYWLLELLWKGNITEGFYISYMTSLIELVYIVNMEFTYVFDELAKTIAFFKDYDHFYCMEEQGRASEQKKTSERVESLEFKNVSFRYSENGPLILDNISFRMEAGKSYALVGRNGAGKSTITKLILKLYDNYTGKILVNGTDIQELETSKYLELCAVVFQDFSRFPLTLHENIYLKNEKDLNVCTNGGKICEHLGIDQIAAKLPEGFRTRMGKVSTEAELSGGEWQKIAIARAMCKESSLQILDEPTAAIDPVYENALYQIFRELLKKPDKLSLIITHRLAASKEVDCILVIDRGKVIEEGSFADLMGRKGIYYEMYSNQKEWYE